MNRKYIENLINSDTIGLLNKLSDEETNSADYALTMYKLGYSFGKIILDLVKDAVNIRIVCTVEDADYLGKGVIDLLEKKGKKVFLSVFWNKYFQPNTENGLAVAPIIREYHDKNSFKIEVLIAISSIISSSCVLRTNLTKILEDSEPHQVLIISPVVFSGALEQLHGEFDNSINRKFSYCYFAEDLDKNIEGHVFPGIGGDVLRRLGFANQDSKNKFVPEIVKARRHNFDSAKTTKTRRKVLIIEDEVEWQDYLKSIFLRGGFSVEIAVDVRNAMSMVRNELFEFITLDMHMPVEFQTASVKNMEGMTVLEDVKNLRIDDRTNIMVVTAFEDIFETLHGYRNISMMSKVEFNSKKFLEIVNREVVKKNQRYCYDLSSI